MGLGSFGGRGGNTPVMLAKHFFIIYVILVH